MFTSNIYIWIVVTILIIFLLCDYMFNNRSEDPPKEKCFKTGCSGQICSDEPVMSTCTWTCEDSCIRGSQCKNINNKCQWDINENTLNCLNECKRIKQYY